MLFDGEIAQPPIALIEAQGYAMRALAGVSELLHFRKEVELAAQTSRRSEQLRGSIEQRFWNQGRRYYAMALDREKRPLEVDSSNSGHLLFSSAVSREGAR